jgi:hypothetical protein
MALIFMLAAGCGAEIPQHNGYKSEKAKPWKKARQLKFDDQNTAKAKGDLSYPDMRRAAWFDIELVQPSELDVNIEVSQTGDTVNEDFDLGVEVLDPGNRKLSRKDKEEGDQTGDEKKTFALPNLPPGHYLLHMYLQSRLDTCDYKMQATLKPTPVTVGKSDFPAAVAFVGPLAMVPITDDTPKGYKPPTATPVVVTHVKHAPPKKEEPKPPPVTTLTARIIGMSVVSGGTQITIGRGTASGAAAGMKGKVNGIATGAFTVAACNERTCTATVPATPDQIKGAGSVVLSP